VDDLDVDGAASIGRCTLSDVGDTDCVVGVISRERHIEIYDVGGAPTWHGGALRSCAHRAASAALARKQVAALDADDPALVWRHALPDVGDTKCVVGATSMGRQIE